MSLDRHRHAQSNLRAAHHRSHQAGRARRAGLAVRAIDEAVAAHCALQEVAVVRVRARRTDPRRTHRHTRSRGAVARRRAEAVRSRVRDHRYRARRCCDAARGRHATEARRTDRCTRAARVRREAAQTVAATGCARRRAGVTRAARRTDVAACAADAARTRETRVAGTARAARLAASAASRNATDVAAFRRWFRRRDPSCTRCLNSMPDPKRRTSRWSPCPERRTASSRPDRRR